jgi:hypothetical protein
MLMPTNVIGRTSPPGGARARRQAMSTLCELEAAKNEYERRLREAEHDRQVKRMENASGKGLATRVAKVVGVLVTVLGLK